MKKRILKVLLVLGLLCGAAVGYALVMELTGHGIPCVFRRLTGLKCPGCGNTHAIHCLAKGQPAEALKWNALMPLEAAFAAWLVTATSLRYIKTGKYILTTGSEKVNIAFLTVILLWWAVRNIIGI